MGSIWEGVGTLWGFSWALLGALGALFERSWGAIQVGETLSPTSKRSGRLLDAILGRFSLDFERFGSDLGSILRGLGEVWEGFGLLFSGSQLEFKFTRSST